MVEGFGNGLAVARKSDFDTVLSFGLGIWFGDVVQLVLRQTSGKLARRAVVSEADLDHAERPQIGIGPGPFSDDDPDGTVDGREAQSRPDRICVAGKVVRRRGVGGG